MSPPGYYPPPTQQVRPSGVSLLAVLYFIEGVVIMITGFGLGALLFFGDPSIALVCGAIGVVLGAFYFLIGWGLWTLRPWARTVALIFAIIGLIGFPVGTLISIIILWYLFRPEIKAAFGEGPMPMAPGYGYPPAYGQPYQYGQPPAYQPPAQPAAPAPPQAQPVQPQPTPAQQPPTGARFCPNCGASVTPGTSFCANCGAKVS